MIETGLINFILHIDEHLNNLIQEYRIYAYLILFLIIFFETGIVVTPFLPGDTLLFAIGSFAAIGSLKLWLSILILSLAAIIGDSVNYSIGKYLGPRVFKKEDSKIFRKEYLDKTNEFYKKYGKKAIVIARFVPIVRTFAPFVAGVGKMRYLDFFKFNVFGGILWVCLFVFLGYFFGNIPFVKENFSILIILIILISIIPFFVELIKSRKRKVNLLN